MSNAANSYKMRPTRRYVWVVFVAVGMAFLLTAYCGAQMPPVPTNSNQQQQQRRIPTPRDPRDMDQQIGQSAASAVFYEKRIQLLNAEQHKSMVADTDRLVKLVADLNAQINNSKASSLTPEQLRTVAEIEKLAHNVRDKMRMSVRSAINNGTSEVPFAPR